MAFRDLISDVDAAVLRDLGDADITIDGRPVEGMFASPWIGPDLGSQRTQLVAPVFHVRDRDAVGVRQGSILIASEERYRVLEAKPDGTGWTILILQ
ncbi:hypothetical protein [Burkholderia sp. A2]|uniref:head-tail joining protein n=1 Tax=Burkholderia sp. A2 TaxID=236253 RepID=UPI00084C1385|nr:hypothetical protein [Burkholderia sp. A2]OED14693.1 hypothetical protein A9Z05_15780 [Burkholderia sp. A2]RQU12396.1 hypothetical protein DF152_20085 [Burkholderia cenocepacia]RQU23077.1 hypothetical protein DF153_18620 [Burkholderia cenocepacia]